jgi:hypothetical protein
MLKKSKILVFLTLMAVAVISISFIAGYVLKGSTLSSASSSNLNVAAPAITQNSTQAPQLVHESNLSTLEVKGVSLQLSGVLASNDTLQVKLCIHLPSTDDWNPEASLIVGRQTVPAQGWGLLNSKNPATYASLDRCYQFSFALPKGFQTQSTPLQVEVERLFIPPPDMPTAEQCAQAQQKLDAERSGIKFTCNLQPNQGGWGYNLLQKAQGMSDDQAGSLIMDAFKQKVIEGPWKFNVDSSSLGQ